MHKFVIPNTIESRKQVGHCIKCQFFKFFKIRVVFEILLNSIVCFFAFSSSYIRVRVIIKVEVFSRFYGTFIILSILISPDNCLREIPLPHYYIIIFNVMYFFWVNENMFIKYLQYLIKK